jgi:hypothetical protein
LPLLSSYSPLPEHLNNIFSFQPVECQVLIDKLRSCSHKELLEVLKTIDTWTFGKCELYHWIDILEISDAILEEAAMRVEPSSWTLACDLPKNCEVSSDPQIRLTASTSK